MFIKHVVRGGSWGDSRRIAHRDSRYWLRPEDFDYPGFRLVRLSEDNGRRVFRGGSWLDEPRARHATYRDRYRPDYRFSLVGFRLIRRIDAK
jgi:formylglycine-generating enzyme required for sulfatase activity